MDHRRLQLGRWLAGGLAVWLTALGGPCPSAGVEPDVAWTLKELQARKEQQLKTAAQSKAFHGFQFTDERARSGITFESRVVDDCTRDFKPIIYDHGTGLAVADVDGDGRTDIYFVNQLGGCQLWRNLGGGRFEDLTATAGVALADRICVAASFADADNDGDPDLFVTTVRMGNVLFENLGGGRFRDVSKAAGVDYPGHSSGAVFFDFDNDGRLDLFVTNVGRYTTDEKGPGGFYRGVADMGLVFDTPSLMEPSLLYRNLGGLKFQLVSKQMNLDHVGWSGDATFCDINEDGFPDLYVLNMSGPNSLYVNQQGRGFANQTRAYFPRTPPGALGIKFFDFDQDGRLDLFITDMHSDMSPLQSQLSERNLQLGFEKTKSEQWCGANWPPEKRALAATMAVFGNAFYQNNGAGRFTEMSDALGAETFWPWGITVADFNADGFEDAFIPSGMGYPFRYGINSLLLNDGGRRFFDAEFLAGVEPRPGNRLDKPVFTLDCAGVDRSHPLCAGQTGRLQVRGALSSRAAAAWDMDDDGDVDLLVNEFYDPPQVLINNLSARRPVNFLKLKLAGTVSNRDGLGAVVRVTAGGRTYTQQHDGKSGYMSQSSLPLYFGLGDAKVVERIEVKWPSGARQAMSAGLGINQLMEIREPKPGAQ
jgi:enediyne biosynthesis protein E4